MWQDLIKSKYIFFSYNILVQWNLKRISNNLFWTKFEIAEIWIIGIIIKKLCFKAKSSLKIHKFCIIKIWVQNKYFENNYFRIIIWIIFEIIILKKYFVQNNNYFFLLFWIKIRVQNNYFETIFLWQISDN